ncbi:MAG TPA: hypothetical protein VLE19_03800 [Pyrinomonadaceae bacterium]|nr:hypothetical protein [Pyrinomonadaceae bacterium]
MYNLTRTPRISLAGAVTISAFLMLFTDTMMGQQLHDKAMANDPGQKNETKVATVRESSLVDRDAPMNRAANPDSSAVPAVSDEDAWHFEVRPYLWLASINGRLRVRNSTAETGKSSSEVLGMLDFAAAAQIEAKKGRFGLMFDENYINLGTDGTGPLGVSSFRVEPTLNIFEFGGSYTFAKIADKNATASEELPPVFSAEVLGGGRFLHLSLRLEPTNLAPVEGSRNLVGVFVGNRFKASPHKALTLIAKYTVGTSGVGSQFAWSFDGLVDFRLKKSFSIGGGYRVLGLNADDANNAVGFDGQLRGLIFTATIFR